MRLIEILQNKTIYGFASSIFAALYSSLNFHTTMQWCQLIAVLLGLIIAVLTIVAKALEIKERRQKRNNKNH